MTAIRIQHYLSGMNVLPVSKFPIDSERIALIDEAKKELELKGQLVNHSSKSKRGKIHAISAVYANERERDDESDTRKLYDRLNQAWDIACGYNFTEEGLSNAAIINIARVLTYVNNQRTPSRYRNMGSLTAPRGLENHYNLEYLMTEMIENANSISHPISKAIYTQFEIFYLQPALNGNKRLGQILAWKILDENGYPSHFVPPKEFDYYTNLLNNASIAVDGKADIVHLEKAVNYMLERVAFSLELIKESEKIVDPVKIV